MAIFEGLLPELHSTTVLNLWFTFTHWHGLAKLCMHTDTMLDILDEETTALGRQLCQFRSATCSAYETHELKCEAAARVRRDQKKGSTITNQGERRPKMLNLQTYKDHSIGDYVETIKQYSTTDSYNSQIVSCSLPTGHEEAYCLL